MLEDFKGLEVRTIDGSDFIASYATLNEVIALVRKERRPFLVHAKVPLLNHHTSGVRKEWYRDDLAEAATRDPFPKLKANSKRFWSFRSRDLLLLKIKQKNWLLMIINWH
jgi:TPP-dependent pyruvate/acetoin dehydrogenase alpha subunit